MSADLETPIWKATRTASATTLLFPQPGALLNLNHRTHWRTRSRVTRQWRQAAAEAALLLGAPARREHAASWVRLIIPVPDRRRRDPANLTPLTKAAVDGLVDAGVWPDDTPEFVETLEPRLVHVPGSKGLIPTIELVIVPRTGETP
jgi:crossover junction endodeoxyribonuclease RusA